MKKYKPLLAKLKWRLRLAWVLLFDSRAKKALLNTDFSSIKMDSFEKELRRLIRLNPSWLMGHYLHGIASFHLYQSTKDGYFLGSLNVCLSLLRERRHDSGHILLLKCLLSFANKNYSLLAKEVQQEESVSLIESLNLEEQVIINEHTGLSLITLNEAELANQYFKKIPEQKRNQDVIGILSRLS